MDQVVDYNSFRGIKMIKKYNRFCNTEKDETTMVVKGAVYVHIIGLELSKENDQTVLVSVRHWQHCCLNLSNIHL